MTYYPRNGRLGTLSVGKSMTWGPYYKYNGSKYAEIKVPDIVLSNPSNQTFLGWSTDSKSTSIAVADKGTFNTEKDTTLYAIIKGPITITFNKANADSLSKYSATCFSYGTGCKLGYGSLPSVYVKGKDLIGMSYYPTGDDVYYATKQNFTYDTTLYVKTGTYKDTYKSLSIATEKIVNGMSVDLENSSGTSLAVFDRYVNKMSDIYTRFPILFTSKSKINFIIQSTFNKRHNFLYNYNGATYGYLEYPNIDVVINSSYSDVTVFTIVHELSHALDYVYGAITGTVISEQEDLKNLYSKYNNYSTSNRPLRSSYSYKNTAEFWADCVSFYYYNYLLGTSSPRGGKSITKSSNADIISIVEKYVGEIEKLK